MEVCGGHTMSIHKFGIPSLLPKNIKLLSGPGCPVCVTSRYFIDDAVYCSRMDDVILTTLGDLIRVPGTETSLYKEKSAGRDIRIVYSVLDAIKIAEDNRDKRIVFPGIGFETTAPLSAAAILQAAEIGLDNFYILSAHKVMPPVMAALIDEGVNIDGYLCPGHVSVITGIGIYEPIVKNYALGCVVSGFEPLDILQSIYMLVNQIEKGQPKLENQYFRAVKPEGNIKAQEIMYRVFETTADWWRGIGTIPDSGLSLTSEFKAFDARQLFEPLPRTPSEKDKGCICGEILKGLKTPDHCPLFGKVCTPVDPVGACMVSGEGSCAAWYKYAREAV
jgi:hydrogenase expression/formation protein HypD